MEDKICFVVMGFGNKTDYASGETINMDKTYHNIIKPAVEEVGLKCVRADEIHDSGMIDRSMYALLVRADVVIADISTMNPNAIYELGVRHAVKPQSTIIIKAESKSSIPFDINHSRTITYKHLGEDIGVDEAERVKNLLKATLGNILQNKMTDSPMYELLHTLVQPNMTDEEYVEIVGAIADESESIFALTETAKQYMRDSNFASAIRYWKKAAEKCPGDVYYIQQLALCTYKQKADEDYMEIYLNDALRILEEIKDTNDPETFGLRGAIYKRLSEHNRNNIAYLDRAIDSYKKGYMLNFDYYTGENLAFCYDLKASMLEEGNEEKIFCKLSAQKIRKEIYDILSQKLEFEDITKIPNVKWMLVSFSICCMALGEVKGNEYETRFMQMAEEWEKNSYIEQKERLLKLLNINSNKDGKDI